MTRQALSQRMNALLLQLQTGQAGGEKLGQVVDAVRELAERVERLELPQKPRLNISGTPIGSLEDRVSESLKPGQQPQVDGP